MSSIFRVLFPEIWAMIHRELVTPLDARARVSLQRTCRAAHALDPGLILAPLWLAAWAEETHGRTSTLFECLTQLDRLAVFDWCPLPERGNFLNWDEENPEYADGIFLEWTMRKETKVYPCIVATLDYERYTDERSGAKKVQWSFSFFIGEDYDDLRLCNDALAETLEELLLRYPRLCHGLEMDLKEYYPD
jgi:hypothetical protein